MTTNYFKSPIGNLKIISDDKHIVGIDFCNDEVIPTDIHLSSLVKDCIQQLTEYFAHQRTNFDLPLKLSGTEFQNKAWQALQKIPYGQTVSYQEQSSNTGNPKAVRAIGHANSKNPIAIVVPCHRVIGKNGKLTGYAGELWRKEWLLSHEKQMKN